MIGVVLFKNFWDYWINILITLTYHLHISNYIILGLQKQMLFMRCAFESRQENLTLYPFPGLKVVNIRGSNLLALDLIVIGKFITCLADHNRLLELSLRDYPLDRTGLDGLMICLPLVRTITLCARLLKDPACYYQVTLSDIRNFASVTI
jgi:hypothetical protein